MNELLAACVANPDDDAPRLEWANRVGGERGELVAVQCAIARGALPRGIAIERRRREKELLAAHAEAYSGLAGLVSAWVFRRGFVEEALVDPADFAAKGEAIFRRAPLLSRVQLDGIDDAPSEDVVRRIDAMIASPWFSRVKKLRIAGAGQWVDTDSDYNPRDFRAAGSAIVKRLVEAKALTNLRGLELPRNGLSGGDVARILACPESKGLRVLDVGNQEIGRYVGLNGNDVWSVIDAPNLEGIEELDVAGAYGLAPLTGTEAARREATRARYQRDARIFEHPRILDLRKLGIAKAVFSEAAAAALPQAPFTRLESLDLSKNEVIDTDWSRLAASPGLATLRELTFDGPCKYVFNVKWAKALGEAPGFPSLRTVAIRNNLVGVDAARALLTSPLAARLEVIDLRANRDLASAQAELAKLWDGVLLVGDV